MFDSVLGAARVARSRPANPIIPNSARIDRALNPSSPGRRMIKTPRKPTPIADHRRQPTVSPKNSAAPATTTKGVACKIAEAEDSGVRAMASV